MTPPTARAVFWKRVRRLTLALVGVWLAVTLIGPWFARDLSGFSVGGFPLSYWMASQGALLLFLLIIVVYVVVMERLERRLLAEETDADGGHG